MFALEVDKQKGLHRAKRNSIAHDARTRALCAMHLPSPLPWLCSVTQRWPSCWSTLPVKSLTSLTAVHNFPCGNATLFCEPQIYYYDIVVHLWCNSCFLVVAIGVLQEAIQKSVLIKCLYMLMKSNWRLYTNEMNCVLLAVVYPSLHLSLHLIH